jgi:peptidoglycan hydrolase-like protein with peptidoglycan-binding domain
MRPHLRLLAACATLSLAAASPALAAAAEVPPVPVVPVPPAPLAGSMKLVLSHVGGSPPFALIGGRIAVRGSVSPYVAGQTVKLSIYRQGNKVAVQVLSVLPAAGGTGSFSLSFSSAHSGSVDIRAAHYANAQQVAFAARAPIVRFVAPNLGPGSSGQSVRLLQSELNVLHYAVPLSGVFDEGTGRALIAYRKVTGLSRVAYSGTQVFRLLSRRAGAFHVRYPHDGRHVEGDLTRQVLAEIEPGGRVRTIYTMSSGKPSTPTVVGHFRVYLKTPGVNTEGMVDSNYFISGYAIHGYPEVPTWAASHGCLRVPIPDAPAIFSWAHEGTPVDVYNENGGGTFDVRANVGP